MGHVRFRPRNSRRRRFAAAGAATTLLGLGIWLPLTAPADAAPANGKLNISSPASTTAGTGSTVSGRLTFAADAPGCTQGNSAVVTMRGASITNGSNADGSINIVGAQAIEKNKAISIDSGGLTWDGIAQANAITRPLTGTFTIKLQCVEDGEQIASAFMDREVTFSGTTWTQSGTAAASPTPTPTASPSPTPAGSTPTPTPGSDATPTPAPGGCDPALDLTCTNNHTGGGGKGAKGGKGGSSEGGTHLPSTGGTKPSEATTLAILLIISGLMFLAFTVEPQWVRGDSDGSS